MEVPAMNVTELLAGNLAQGHETLKQHLADFSDADMFVRPTAGANHAAWQVGHLLSFETMLCGMYAPQAAPKLPENFNKMHGSEGAKVDDPAQFLKKDEMLKLLDQSHGALVAWAKGMKPEDLDKPGPEKLKGWVNTVGELVLAIPMHATMHIGQIQVIRRRLGKKVLF
jgi:hypothetical protein